MPIITIRGQLGSGAPEIGKKVADRLHVDYIDREIISDVAGRLKCAKEGVESKEMPPGSLLGRVAEALGRAYPVGAEPGAFLPMLETHLDDSRYFAGLEAVIKELARSQAVVIQGRGSQFILKDYPGSIHVFVVAQLELRLKRIMQSLRLDEGNARKEIERFDSSRREFAKHYFHASLEDPINYDLVISTDHFTFDNATSIIVATSYRDSDFGS